MLAENASQALEIIKRNDRLDLLFTDVVMPGGMNGFELVKQASKLRPDLKVIVTSGFTSKNRDDIDKSIKIFKKPYRKENLAYRIRNTLDGQY